MDEIIRIVPDFCLSITGTACRVKRKVECTLVSMRAVVILRAGIHQILVVPNARIVDEDVQTSKCIDGSLDSLNRRSLFAGVADDGDSLRSKRFSLLFRCIKTFPATGCEDEPGPLASQRTGARLSDTGARPRDECYFSSEFLCHILLGFGVVVQLS
jgi:hypothetical protein